MKAPLRSSRPWVFLSAAALALGCVSPYPGYGAITTPAAPAQRDSAAEAIRALQAGQFADAERLAAEASAAEPDNPYSHLVSAIVHYKSTNHQLWIDGRTVVLGALEGGTLNQKYLTVSLTDAEADLAAVERDLAVAARRTGLSLELCPACWEVDWNGRRGVDERDRRLLEIEIDADGNDLPEDDPRRRPTFRFDDGDIAWARAFVSFERAALDVLLAYDWTDVALLAAGRGERPPEIVVRLVRPERIAEARQRILEGLALSDACRKAYLAETDDDREWVPSPAQRSHPMPLPVDRALYDTWAAVLGDLQRILAGEEGLSAADALSLAEEDTKGRPRGTIALGAMLAHPKDIVLDLRRLHSAGRHDDTESILRALLGDYYTTSLPPSPLTGRLLRMKREIDEGEDQFGRKLRYLLWLN